MDSYSFAIITPSYEPDFERCQILSRSIERFVPRNVTHYIIVDKRDLKLFKQIKTPNTEIVTKEELLSSLAKFYKLQIPFSDKNIWVSLRTLPIRGWIIQQITKLAIGQHVQQDVLIFVDSDAVFVRPFDCESFVQNDQVRLFRIPNFISEENERHRKWYEVAARLLDIPMIGFPAPGYVGQVVSWRRDNVLKLYKELEDRSGRSWFEAVANSRYLSEYVLYGVFVEQVLKDRSGHYFTSQDICHGFWGTGAMSDEELQQFFSNIKPEHVAVMISAKAGIPAERYRTFLSGIRP